MENEPQVQQEEEEPKRSLFKTSVGLFLLLLALMYSTFTLLHLLHFSHGVPYHETLLIPAPSTSPNKKTASQSSFTSKSFSFLQHLSTLEYYFDNSKKTRMIRGIWALYMDDSRQDVTGSPPLLLLKGQTYFHRKQPSLRFGNVNIPT